MGDSIEISSPKLPYPSGIAIIIEGMIAPTAVYTILVQLEVDGFFEGEVTAAKMSYAKITDQTFIHVKNHIVAAA